MKRLLLIFTLAILSSVAIFAQQSLLYKISGNNLQKPSYLFGTIHIICPDDFTMPEQLSPALESCEQVLLEIDMTDPQLMQKMQMGMMNPNMKNIKADLSAEDISAVDKALVQHFGTGIDQLGILKPWALSTMLSVKLAVECPQPIQYEAEIMKLATEAEKPIDGLETVEFQLKVFDNIPYETQLKLMMEAVNDVEEQKALFAKMVLAYKAEDVDMLYDLFMEEEEMKQFAEFLLHQRNQNWLEVLEKTLPAKACFIAVGAGHMGGEKGLLKLLENAGYSVDPVE